MVIENKIQQMRDYWLEVLPDNEALLVETQWFGNDEESELLEVVKNDLIEDYLFDNLTVNERKYFEKSFLINNLDEIALNRILLDISQEKVNSIENNVPKFSGFFESIWAFMKMPQVAFLASIVLLLCAGLAYIFYNTEPTQIANNTEPATNVSPIIPQETNPQIADVSNKKVETNVQKTNTTNKKVINENTQTESIQNVNNKVEKPIENTKIEPDNKETKKEEVKVKPSQVLLLTSFRGGTKSLKLSDTEKNFDLQLEMPGLDKTYQSYEIRVYDANQNLVLKQKVNENLASKKSGQRIYVKSVKAANFKKNNTYRISLVGVDEKKEVKELNLYDSFKID
jgi:hypothetical protein